MKAAPTRRTVGPQTQMAAVCRTKLMPKVARMVVSGSLPMSERSALRCMISPKTKTHSAAAARPSQKLPVMVKNTQPM